MIEQYINISVGPVSLAGLLILLITICLVSAEMIVDSMKESAVQ